MFHICQINADLVFVLHTGRQLDLELLRQHLLDVDGLLAGRARGQLELGGRDDRVADQEVVLGLEDLRLLPLLESLPVCAQKDVRFLSALMFKKYMSNSQDVEKRMVVDSKTAHIAQDMFSIYSKFSLTD